MSDNFANNTNRTIAGLCSVRNTQTQTVSNRAYWATVDDRTPDAGWSRGTPQGIWTDSVPVPVVKIGEMRVRVNHVRGHNAVLSGLFFDPQGTR